MSNDINERFANFREGCDSAPAHAYEREKEMREAMGNAVDALAKLARTMGMKPCMSDGAHHVEATIYAWLTKDSLFGSGVEGLGKYGDPHGRYLPGAAFEQERAHLISLGVLRA